MTESLYARPEPVNLTKQSVYNFAADVAREFELNPGDDIYGFVAKLGGRVAVEDTIMKDPSQSGSLYVDGVGDFKIIIPAHTSPRRDRFTIAHEVGHYFLHYLLPEKHLDESRKKMKALRKDSDRVEWEANWFAAGLLMPEDSFRDCHAKRNGDIDEIADVFGVSYSAAEIRARSLNLE